MYVKFSGTFGWPSFEALIQTLSPAHNYRARVAPTNGESMQLQGIIS